VSAEDIEWLVKIARESGAVVVGIDLEKEWVTIKAPPVRS